MCERQLLSKNGIGSQQTAKTIIMYWDLGGRGDEEKKKRLLKVSNWNNSKKKWNANLVFFFGSRFFLVWGFSRNFPFWNRVQAALLTSFCVFDGFSLTFYSHFSFYFVVFFSVPSNSQFFFAVYHQNFWSNLVAGLRV